MNNLTDLSETFEAYCLRTQKMANSVVPSVNGAGSSMVNNVSTGIQSRFNSFNTYNNESIFSQRTQRLLENFTGFEQKKILKFWYDIITFFGRGRVRYDFGDEPDRHLMSFAASLNEHSYARLINNLEERLKKGQEWPPSIAVFGALTRTPTDREILDARTNILTLGQPISRVEKYIAKRKSAKLRTLSEKFITQEFKILYVEAFEEVIINNRDKVLDKHEETIQTATAVAPKTKIDMKIDEMITNGLKPKGKIGEHLESINQLRKSGIHST
ncbi:hypothetical protein [Candidatus Enterovibrio altilux]|uniref:Uncharacterized protein n=1 Tax=Candidatus Enterovibrio altilux TaxID=1927128 RepID=A0A291B808_9GAMM|nr:hypothetical protein [Candidatus Enterovibrio luxaltus]ATF09135.1 hypothetical protein BTN50_0613 [Candidatus Enterovibrio luxaltus]